MIMLVEVPMNDKNTDECVQSMTMLVDTEREKRVKGRRKNCTLYSGHITGAPKFFVAG